MLKKRILASSLASVMALSSVSVVAFADETATANYGEAVTKAELKELLAEIEKDVDKGVYDEYGTKYGELFTKAYEAANLAVEDGDADYITASYQVLQAVLAKKQNVGIDELKELVSDLSGKYNKGNIINDELEDDYYYETDTWADFVNAYEAAEVACESDNQTEICDAYFDLVDADNGLKSTTQVTKSQLNKAYQEYRSVIEQKNKYEAWRRGTATESVNSGSDATTKPDFKDSLVTYGDLFGIIAGSSNAVTLEGKNVVGAASPTDDDTWIKFPNAQSTLEEAIDASYGKFMALKTATKTANAEIVTAYNACVDAVRVFKGWKVDDVRRGSKAQFEALVRANATTLWTLDLNSTAGADSLETSTKAAFFDTSVSSASFSIKDGKIYLENSSTSADLEVYLDENGKLQSDPSTGKFINTTLTGNKTVNVPKNDGVNNGKLDVTNKMPVFNLVTAGSAYVAYLDGYCLDGSANGVTLTDALQAKANIDAGVAADATDFSAEFGISAALASSTSLSKEYNDIMNVTAKTNSAVAYSLAYRILEYALDDIIPAPDKSYKKADVKAYVPKANELLEKAEKSATFATEAAALADELAATAEWLAAANKKDYVEYAPVTYTAVKSTAGIDDQSTSTMVWKAIDAAYVKLNDKLAQYPYSYEEISATIAEAAEGLDDKAYSNADAVAAAIEKVAYDLVTLNTEPANANNPYDEDTFAFIAFNRVKKDGTESEKTLVADYEALLKAMKDTSAGETGVKGDLNGDGTANAKDALAILKANAEGKEFTAAEIAIGDVNGDGAVNAKDALAILKANVNG